MNADRLDAVLQHASGFECFAARSLSLRGFSEPQALDACDRLFQTRQLKRFLRFDEWWYCLPDQNPLLPTPCPELDPNLIDAQVREYVERLRNRRHPRSA
jgi:hypothetical protein